jgi:predicted nucleic acid-binding OB-fold protein
MTEHRSKKSDSVYAAVGEKDRAFLKVTGHAATLPKVKRIVDNVRIGGGTFDQVDFIARQLSHTY